MPTHGCQWTLVNSPLIQGRIFRRPLDAAELSFLWDGLFNGTADNVQHVVLRRFYGDENGDPPDLFTEANVIRAWLSTKRRYPLVGAMLVPSDRDAGGDLTNTAGAKSKSPTHSDSEMPTEEQTWDFVVREEDLAILRPGEVVFGEVANAEEAQRRAMALIANDPTNPRPLSDELLVRLYVFHEANLNTRGSPGPASSSVLHVVTLMAHCVTDGMANHTFLRCFIDALARGSSSGVSVPEPTQVPLEERLMSAVPLVELEPAHVRTLSLEKRRWRRAVGRVIFQLRMAKRQGGHTLPCRLTHSTPYTAARSCRTTATLTLAQSSAVIANCRLHNVTFGNALMPLAQVAMTRVLFRRYLRGEISEAEWEHRKRQPHISGGPLNLRPYLDQEWFKRGGGGEFVLSIFLSYSQLPFMTLGSTGDCRSLSNLLGGAPPFGELLSFDRFLYRAGLVKKQIDGYLKHPLSFEIACAVSLARLERTRNGALGWMKRSPARDNHDEGVLAATDMPMVWAHGGSSLGDTGFISPSEYPLPPTHPLSPYSSAMHPAKAGYVLPPPPLTSPTHDTRPTILAEYTATHLHSRPAELYLGAASSRGLMTLFVFYDGNVYEDAVVKEWLNEVKGAVLWYLGQIHPKSQKTDGRGSDRDVGAGIASDSRPTRHGQGCVHARL